MLPFRSLDPFRPLREPDRRRRDEERLSRSEQRTANKPKDHLTGKAPYRFESASLQQRVGHEPHGQNRTRSCPEPKFRIQLSPAESHVQKSSAPAPSNA